MGLELVYDFCCLIGINIKVYPVFLPEQYTVLMWLLFFFFLKFNLVPSLTLDDLLYLSLYFH